MSESWNLFYFKVFDKQYDNLIKEVSNLREIDPENYKNHPKTKLLSKVTQSIRKRVMVNPLDPQFNLGKTLGKKFTEYRRVKEGLPSRYRLFFRFRSAEENIVIIWMNDEFTLRKVGDKKDVYNVFLRMITRGEIPASWSDLLKSSASK